MTQKFGKISAGTSISEKGKTRTTLAIRPFTLGRYDLKQTRNTWHLNGAEVIKSYYAIGENVDKNIHCSYALEFTEKLLPEETPAPRNFKLLTEYFELMEHRGRHYETLTLAYLIKALQIWGVSPETERCTICGSTENLTGFSVRDGGLICKDCMAGHQRHVNDKLLYSLNFDIVNIIRYLLGHPLQDLAGLAMDESIARSLSRLIRQYASWHLDIANLKSETLFTD